jgi:PKD repeat protein
MRRAARLARHALGALAVALTLAPAAVAATDVGVRGPHFSGTGTMVTGAKTESKAWFNDGTWWAAMWDEVAGDNYIYRLDPVTQMWTTTGVMLDNRSGTRSDVLWDGTKLYVASHGYSNTSSEGFDSRLYRYSYNQASGSYTLDIGYPVVMNRWKTESLVIDKDAAGKLWATWVQGTTVYVNRTTGDDRSWGTPFALPAADATRLTTDDVSSVVAFGDKVGVMWSNQSSWRMNFSVHTAGDPDTAWSATEAANSGTLNADDHINLKADADGKVYAAVKTEQTTGTAPLIELAVRDPAGTWTRHVFGRKDQHHTRPIVLLDEQRRTVHMFATSGEAGGTIYEKTASMDDISFPEGMGTPFVQDGSSADVNDATSTKQSLTPASGLLVLASNDTTDYYWHNFRALGPVPLTADFTASPRQGDPPLEVTFTDHSTGTPTSWSWDFGDGMTSTERNPVHTYTEPGRYSVTLTVANATGTNTTTKTDLVAVASVVADFTASPTTGPAPLAVTFTDTSTGAPGAWSWDFGDGSTSTEQRPVHTYTAPGVYTVSLTATNTETGQADTATRTGLVTVREPSSALRLTPVEDAYVRSLSPTTNYGGAGTLRVKDGGATGEHYRSFLKFDVAGLSGPVTHATLRLYVLDPATSGGNVFVASNAWSERGTTWSTQPPLTGSPIAALGAVALDSWVEVPLPASAFAAGAGTYTLAIVSPGPSGGTAWYASREDPRSPELVLGTD